MNKIFLTGTIGKEPEAQYTASGKYVCKNSLAVSVGWGDKKTTNWYNLIVWGDQGERFKSWISKGSRVLIEGALELQEWKDKEGATHVSPNVTVSYFEVLNKKENKENKETPDDNELPF